MKITILLLLTGSVVTYGAIVQSSSLLNVDGTAPDTLIINSMGVPVSLGIATSGGFNVSDTIVQTLATAAVTTGDFTALIASFTGFLGSDDFQTGVDTAFGTGDIAGAYALTANLDPTPFIGQTLYSFIGNGGTLGTSTEFALYQHVPVLAADPAAPAAPSEYSLLISGGSILIGTPTTIQSTDGNLGTNNTQVNAIRLVQAVPEPSTLLLSAFGVLGLLRRKR